MTALKYLRSYAEKHNAAAAAKITEKTTMSAARDFFASENEAKTPLTNVERRFMVVTFPSAPTSFASLDEEALCKVYYEYKEAVPRAVNCLPCTHPGRLLLLNDTILLKDELKKRVEAQAYAPTGIIQWYDAIRKLIAEEMIRFADFVAELDGAMVKSRKLARFEIMHLDEIRDPVMDEELRVIIVDHLMKMAADLSGDAFLIATYMKCKEFGSGLNKTGAPARKINSPDSGRGLRKGARRAWAKVREAVRKDIWG